MISDIKIFTLTTPSIKSTTKNATNLLAVFTAFGSINQAAFKKNSNYTLPFRYCCGTTDVLGSLKAIIQLGKDTVDLFGTEGMDVPTWVSTAKDATNLYNTINDGNCHSGTHANGHISEGVNAAAGNGLNKLKDFQFDDQTRVGKIKVVLEKCFSELFTLQTQGHNLWLKPDWQIKYYVIMQATAQKLSALNN